MAFLYTATSTKPAGVKWYGEVNRAIIDEINEWTMEYPGILGYKPVLVSENEHKYIHVFQDRTTLDKFVEDRAAHAGVIVRQQYNIENGIVMSKEIKEI